VYVHRSGRTARAKKDGFSLLLCSPEEVTVYKQISHLLNRPMGIPELDVDHSILPHLKKRIALAKEIDTLVHLNAKQKHDKNWIKKMAEEADIELDDTM